MRTMSGGILADGFDRLLAAAGGADDLEPVRTEELRECIPERAVVVDDENSNRIRAGPAPRGGRVDRVADAPILRRGERFVHRILLSRPLRF